MEALPGCSERCLPDALRTFHQREAELNKSHLNLERSAEPGRGLRWGRPWGGERGGTGTGMGPAAAAELRELRGTGGGTGTGPEAAGMGMRVGGEGAAGRV